MKEVSKTRQTRENPSSVQCPDLPTLPGEVKKKEILWIYLQWLVTSVCGPDSTLLLPQQVSSICWMHHDSLCQTDAAWLPSPGPRSDIYCLSLCTCFHLRRQQSLSVLG